MLEAFVDGYLGFKQPHKRQEIEEAIKRLLVENNSKDGETAEELCVAFMNNPESFNVEVTREIQQWLYEAVVSELVECPPKIVHDNRVVQNSSR